MKTSAISRQRKDIHPVKKYAIFLNPEYNIYCGVGAKDLGNFYHPSQAPSFSWKVPAQTLAPAPCGFIAAEHSHTNPSRCSWASVGIYCLVYPNPRASLLSCRVYSLTSGHRQEPTEGNDTPEGFRHLAEPGLGVRTAG